MTDMPTLADVFAVEPEQLTGLTPIEIDRMNAVAWEELARRGNEVARAEDRVYGALLISKESRRRGNGYSQVWPISVEEAVDRAASHLETGHQLTQSEQLRYGLYGDAYAEGLRKALGILNAAHASVEALSMGPVETLDAEFRSRGGWSRMYLCTSDGGHIHRGRQCPSIGPRTHLAWLPEVSGMEWREAFPALPQNLAAGSPAIMCTKCYEDAPTEWTVKAVDEKECPGSRKHAKLMAPGMMRRMSRYAECHVCHKPGVSVTGAGNLRKHDKPEGGEEAAPEAPAPEAPAADKPRDDNRLTIIERTPLQTPPATTDNTAPAAKGKPGGNPTVVHVAAHLNRAGFKLARYTGRMGGSGAGAKVSKAGIRNAISVSWREDFDSVDRRLSRLGLSADDFGKLPAHPEEEQRIRDYAAALAPRYAVEVSQYRTVGGWVSTSLYVSRREELPIRPKGLPGAAAVARAMREDPRVADAVDVVDQIDHVRVAVGDEDDIAPVREALAANGWTFEEPAPAVEHYLFHITGSAPDRPARLRKLRAERATKAQQAAEEAAQRPAVVDTDPQPTVVQWAPQEAEEAAVEEPPTPVPSEYDSKGRRWRQGQRAEFKTVDGFLYAGEIVGFGEEGGEKTATILADTRRGAPASRKLYKGDPNLPGKPRPLDPAEEWTRPLTKLSKPLPL
jgi:hypothetical protein